MKYQNHLNNGKIKCLICPRECVLSEGQRGFCLSRINRNEVIFSENYGYNSGMAIDPIEKKPLYHFYPGSKVLSFGTYGCNMGCLFCQNHHISKNIIPLENCTKASPEEIVTLAKKYDCKSVAFTYNEPAIFFEYAIDTAKLCRKNGIKTVAVTSGYFNPEPAKEFFSYMDAANIDLKGFNPEFYKRNCLAKFDPVWENIKHVVKNTNCHVELTMLLIEGENTDINELKQGSKRVVEEIGDSVPFHFSAFFPRYKFSNRKPTGFKILYDAYNIAYDSGMKYVYIGNLATIETSSTYCKNCNRLLIKRNGYNILINNLENGKCKYCGTECDGRF